MGDGKVEHAQRRYWWRADERIIGSAHNVYAFRRGNDRKEGLKGTKTEANAGGEEVGDLPPGRPGGVSEHPAGPRGVRRAAAEPARVAAAAAPRGAPSTPGGGTEAGHHDHCAAQE